MGPLENDMKPAHCNLNINTPSPWHCWANSCLEQPALEADETSFAKFVCLKPRCCQASLFKLAQLTVSSTTAAGYLEPFQAVPPSLSLLEAEGIPSAYGVAPPLPTPGLLLAPIRCVWPAQHQGPLKQPHQQRVPCNCPVSCPAVLLDPFPSCPPPCGGGQP